MKYKHIYLIVSAILFVASILSLLVFKLVPGIDFRGGSLIELSFANGRPDVAQIQIALEPLNLGTVVVQPTKEKNMLIKTRFITEEEHQKILEAMRVEFQEEASAPVTVTTEGGQVLEGVAIGSKTAPDVIEERVETVGPSISSHLKGRAISAGIATILITLIYIGYAFRRVSRPVASWKYGAAAILAMIYNITVIMGVFAILGRFRGVEVDIPFVVALMTIFGYSINDTIVVFDRVRENLTRYRGESFAHLVDRGINETIVRSLTTGGATLLVLVALFFFGGATIHYFSLALIIGIVFGTTSSIFVASALLVAWEEYRTKSVASV